MAAASRAYARRQPPPGSLREQLRLRRSRAGRSPRRQCTFWWQKVPKTKCTAKIAGVSLTPAERIRTFSISRGQSRTCSGYAEARKGAKKLKDCAFRTFVPGAVVALAALSAIFTVHSSSRSQTKVDAKPPFSRELRPNSAARKAMLHETASNSFDLAGCTPKSPPRRGFRGGSDLDTRPGAASTRPPEANWRAKNRPGAKLYIGTRNSGSLSRAGRSLCPAEARILRCRPLQASYRFALPDPVRKTFAGCARSIPSAPICILQNNYSLPVS